MKKIILSTTVLLLSVLSVNAQISKCTKADTTKPVFAKPLKLMARYFYVTYTYVDKKGISTGFGSFGYTCITGYPNQDSLRAVAGRAPGGMVDPDKTVVLSVTSMCKSDFEQFFK